MTDRGRRAGRLAAIPVVGSRRQIIWLRRHIRKGDRESCVVGRQSLLALPEAQRHPLDRRSAVNRSNGSHRTRGTERDRAYGSMPSWPSATAVAPPWGHGRRDVREFRMAPETKAICAAPSFPKGQVRLPTNSLPRPASVCLITLGGRSRPLMRCQRQNDANRRIADLTDRGLGRFNWAGSRNSSCRQDML